MRLGLNPRLWALMISSAFAAVAGPAQSPGEYRPKQIVSGEIRVWGDSSMTGLVKAWEAGLRKHHPDLRLAANLKGTDTAQFGLAHRVADIALVDRPISPVECYGVFRRSQRYPVEIEVATGSWQDPQKGGALAIIVHPGNPLTGLALEELDGIFGAERTGGWDRLDWRPEAARPASRNIRTWGQLGLTGKWATAPIHVYGPPSVFPGGQSYFQKRVLQGADSLNEEWQEIDGMAGLIAAVAGDPLGIAYVPSGAPSGPVKVLALAGNKRKEPVTPSRQSVEARSYPLARSIYLYFATDNEAGDPNDPKVDPKLDELISYILSREGQADVARDGSYLPLPEAIMAEQASRLAAAR